MSDDHILKLVKENEPFHEVAAKGHPGPKEFVHLHNHTLYSPLDGIASPEEYMCACEYFDHPGFAITDHGSLGAVPDAHFASQRHNVKYMVGIEVYFNDYHNEMKKFTASGGKLKDLKEEDPELVDRFRRNRHLTVIAKNSTGVKNLFHLTSQAWKIGFYYKPRIWMDQLLKYKEGLIILSGCLNGPVCHELRMAKKKLDENLPGAQGEAQRHNRIAISYIKKFREEFGDDFYLELQMPGDEIENGKYCFKMISALSEKMNIPAVVTNDCHYLNREAFNTQKAMMAVGQDTHIHDPNLFHVNSDEQFFKTRAQMRKTFFDGGYNKWVDPAKFEEYCDNTLRVMESCDYFEPDMSPKLPEIPNADAVLRMKIYDALRDRGLMDNEKRYYIDGKKVTYKEQAEIELQRLNEKKFDSYFLITEDLINYSRNQLNKDVGPARGSAGGSLICYLLGITNLDPLKWGLSFDRFLSVSRGGYMLKATME